MTTTSSDETTDSTPTTEPKAAAAATAGLGLCHVDPGTLLVDRNVRHQVSGPARAEAAAAMRTLVASVREHAGDEPAGHGGCAEPAGPQRGWVIAAWCLDPAGNGYVDRWSRLAAHNGAEADPERRRADRAEVITQKRAWKAATAVRRDWLAQFATRRTATKGSGLWVAAMLAKGSHPARRAMESGYPLARQLLTGRTDPVPHGTSPLAGVLDGATEGRAGRTSAWSSCSPPTRRCCPPTPGGASIPTRPATCDG